MAEQDLSLTFSVDSSEATDGIAAVNTALEQTATDAQAAGTAAAALGTNLAEGTAAAAPALSAVDQATQQLKTTLDTLATAMANPNSGPRTLFRDASQASIALTQLKQVAADSGVSLDSLGVNVKNVTATLVDAATKASTATLEVTKLRAAGLEAANQLQALQGKASSLSAMFLEMSRTGNAAEQAVGKMAVGVGIGILAFDAAVAAGNKLGAFLAGLIDKESAIEQAFQKAAQQEQLESIALAAVAAGHLKLGASLPATVAGYELMAAATGKSGIALTALEAELEKLKPPASLNELTLDTAKFAAVLEGTGQSILSEDQMLHDLANSVNLLPPSLVASQVAAGNFDANLHALTDTTTAARNATDLFTSTEQKALQSSALFLQQHKQAIDTMLASYATIGQKVPEDLQNIVTAWKQSVAAQKLLSEEAAAAAIMSFEKITAARVVADAADVKSTQAAVGNYESQMKALNAETVTSEEYSARKAALYALEQSEIEGIQLKQQLAVDEEALAQAKLQKSLAVSASTFQDVADAAGIFDTQIKQGATPTDALTVATSNLRQTIVDTDAALPDLSTGIDTLVKSYMAAQATGTDYATQVAQSATSYKKAQDAADLLRKSMQGVTQDMKDTGIAINDLVQRFNPLVAAMNAFNLSFG